MNKLHRQRADKYYLVLTTLFITSLVACNLIANKFITIDLGFKTFIISAGVLPYPITFLMTDLLSEIYGRAKANKAVLLGFLASIFTIGILWLGNQFDAIPDSPVDNETYSMVFGNSVRVILASMTAYLVAQLVDVRLYHFWKDLTKGKHLWLRNNFSTVLSQLVDTTLVVGVLFLGSLTIGEMGNMVFDGWLFKSLCAVIDTPVLYFLVFVLKKRLGLNENIVPN